jgi:hypothetical protein
MKIVFGIFSFIVVSALLGGMALAGNPSTVPPGKGIPAGPKSGEALLTLLVNITDWIFAFIMVAAVIFIVLAAFQFITSGGDASAVSEARKKLMYAAI